MDFPQLNDPINSEHPPVPFDGLEFDPKAKTLRNTKTDVVVELKLGEIILMRLLAANVGKVVPTTELNQLLAAAKKVFPGVDLAPDNVISRLVAIIKKLVQSDVVFRSCFPGYYRLGNARWENIKSHGNIMLDLDAYMIRRGSVEAQLIPSQMQLMLELLPTPEAPERFPRVHQKAGLAIVSIVAKINREFQQGGPIIELQTIGGIPTARLHRPKRITLPTPKWNTDVRGR